MAVYDVNMVNAQFADGISAESISVSSTAKTLTVPTGANAALVCVHTNTIRASIGTTATATLGLAFASGDMFYVYGTKNLTSLSLIRESADATVTVQYFNIRNVGVI